MLSEERLAPGRPPRGPSVRRQPPAPSQCHYDVSPEFRWNMKKLCRQAKRRPYRKVWKAVACAALVLILGSTSYLGLNAQAREAFFGWVTQITQNVSHYFFSAALTSTRKITVTFCRRFQRGYTQDAVDEDGGLRSELYVNEQGDYLAFETQYVTEESAYELFMDVDGLEITKVMVQGVSGDLYVDPMGKQSSTLIWKDPETDVLLSLTAYLPKDELISLADTIVRQEK